jgi:hypothetical protein
MSSFTHWDINVFLCLLSLGLSDDLIRDWIKKLKKTHEELVLKNARKYHCDRGKFVDMGGYQMVYYSRADLSDPSWHFPRAISKLESIPVEFHNSYENGPVAKIRHLGINILNLNRIFRQNFELAYLRRYINREALEWSRGIHPGRLILMEKKFRPTGLPIIVGDFYSFGNWCRDISLDSKKNSKEVPEYKKKLIEMDINRNGWCILQFIRSKDHIDDMY